MMSIMTGAAANQTIESGPFTPSWEGLSGWECPEWFKDAKFGIWAHWGPQCQAEAGDWYGRGMYQTGSAQNLYHTRNFGDPSTYGLKELCRDWKADKWNPEALVELYKSVGAKYFFTLGQHHDNFDLWDSSYQQWNSVAVGPHRDIVKEWHDACEKNGLRFGISMHGSHTWTWLEPAQDYDGNLTAADGEGTWWEGLDPQELYAQRHKRCADNDTHWEWGGIGDAPTEAYKQKFVNRVIECINRFNPDIIYFDDTVLPFYYLDNSVGLGLLTHYYNHSANSNNGVPQVVATGKVLNDEHKQGMLWDVERGVPNDIQEDYWQTCTCIGSWHYDRSLYENNGYKDACWVIDLLIDVVSKNGNLLLSVPIRGDGSLDDKELAILDEIKEWMDQNGCAIYATRPWKVFGEGPLAEKAAELNNQGFNESNNYSAKDVRYLQGDGNLYAFILRWPEAGTFSFENLSFSAPCYSGRVKMVELVGGGNIEFRQDIDGLDIVIPAKQVNKIAPVFRITFDDEDDSWLPYEEYRNALDARLDEAYELISTVNADPDNYEPLKVEALLTAIETAESINESSTPTEMASAYHQLKTVTADFRAHGHKKQWVSGGRITLWNGNLTGEGTWVSLKIAPTMFNQAHPGDKLVISVDKITGTNDNGGTWSGVQLYNRDPWTNIDWISATAPGNYEIVLTENTISRLLQGGIELEPRYLTLTSVTLDSGKELSEQIIDHKKVTFGNNCSEYDLNASLFQGLKPGDAVVFHIDRAYDEQVGEHYWWSSARVSHKGGDTDYLAGKDDLSQINGDFGIVLTTESSKAIGKHGLRLSGRDFVLNSIAIQKLKDNHHDDAAISIINPDMTNAASTGDCHDLWGRLVSADTKGIIIRDGKKIIVR